MVLSELKVGVEAVILKITGSGSYRKRMMELGLVQGERIWMIKPAPFGDAAEYLIMGTHLVIRKTDASLIEISPVGERAGILETIRHVVSENLDFIPRTHHQKVINVAILGLPNSGKTTLFNTLTGLNERVANYSGVTIGAKEFQIAYKDYKIVITDLPGTQSLCNVSESEELVKRHIIENTPDLILNVVDGTNLERHLYLTTEIIDMDIPMVMALTMYDELEKSGRKLEVDELAKLLACPIVPVSPKLPSHAEALLDVIISVYNDENPLVRHIHINYGPDVEEAIKSIQKLIRKESSTDISNRISPRFLSLKLIEEDSEMLKEISKLSNAASIILEVEKYIEKIEKEYGDSADSIVTRLKFGFIKGALYETIKEPLIPNDPSGRTFDRFLTHPLLGLPIFAFFIWLMFFATFKLGEYPMMWIEQGVQLFGDWIASNMVDSPLKDMMVDGVISGVGGVLVFLPNILLLFFFIAMMEGTGYMSRAVFILDNFMHKIGLHGKSFIPLVMGFGCNVPAIMSTRILENRHERMITMLINPFISCNARLPVYILFAGTFFPRNASLIIFIIYFTGIALAILTALWLRKFVFKTKSAPFVMELPPYRIPTLGSMVKYMWDKAREYLKKIASVILISSVIFWALGYFPTTSPVIEKHDVETARLETVYTSSELPILNVDSLMTERSRERQRILHEGSYLGSIGKSIEPLIKPLGFDWKMGISILSGIPAKEIIISTLAVLYQTDGDDESTHLLSEKIKEQKHVSGPKKGEPFFTPLLAFVFILFVSIYFPCIGSIIAISKESGSYKWGLFSVFYTLALAWLLSFGVYQFGLFLGY
ncbi:MAG: ferrous iron transport protein B [Bacteroidales bacterium]|nr:ferrous iron transport protein B [Bacteroidales bacterium]